LKIKVLTYNVHSCIDINKKRSLYRIGALVKSVSPDIAGLNEIEKHSFRTYFINQPKKIARLASMDYFFGPTLKLGPFGLFGNGILTSKKISNVQNFPLPGNREPRCCLKVQLDVPGGPVTVLVTHLGLAGGERLQQLAELVRIIESSPGPLILMGDFNCNYEELGPLLNVVIDTDVKRQPEPTFPSWCAAHRLDYIFTTPHFRCIEHFAIASDASDHLPVAAVLELKTLHN
jgi:endonuclease/exonuclease/phosphatase family metal-dependent hydrolase